MSATALEGLRRVNQNLSAGLAGIQPEVRDSATITAREIAGILEELLRAADCLRGVSPGATGDLELEKEISEYRRNMEQLQRLLPAIHATLMMERGRLEAERKHLAATTMWATAAKGSL